jgi:uncharacterized membrane protein YfcA
MNKYWEESRTQLAFWLSIPIALLGGLMGLGGAEFRLPVLASILGYSARQSVPLNLAVSLVTILFSLLIRSQTLAIDSLIPNRQILLSLIVGAAISAWLGATWARKISNEQLEKIILVFLVSIGLALIVEAFLPKALPAIIPAIFIWQIVVGILCGLVIGLVSSVLGVAGGELIIPTLIFGFGLDIKTAGTASLIISLPTVITGIIRYSQKQAYRDRFAFNNTVIPMGVGSIIGAILGGMLVGIINARLLKLILGVILIISAFKVFHSLKKHDRF